MADQAIWSNPKTLRIMVFSLGGAVLLLAGSLLGSHLPGFRQAVSSPRADGDREVSLSFGGVGVKMKAKELGQTLDQARRAVESGELNRALLENPNSPLVKLAQAHFPMKMWGAASASLAALDKAGRGNDPKFELLREYVKSYEFHKIFKPQGIHKGGTRKSHAFSMRLLGERMKTEMIVLANSGETAGHLRYYRHPELKGKVGPDLNDEKYRKLLIKSHKLGRQG